MSAVKLICKGVRFYIQKDEAAFFEWIAKIKCIDHISAMGNELYLHIKKKRISNADLRDLIGLFYRYKVDMKQLQIFLNKNNRKWFYEGGGGYWHKRVFGQDKL